MKNMSNVRKLSLSSLAVSVSAAGLLSVTGVASADDPWFCMEGNPCTTLPQWDLYNYWSHSGQCVNAYIEGSSACLCVAEAYGGGGVYYVFGPKPECEGGW